MTEEEVVLAVPADEPELVDEPAAAASTADVPIDESLESFA